MNRRQVARELVDIAREIVAVKSPFTVLRPVSLKREGATRDSLENARKIRDAGYELVNAALTFDKNMAHYETKAYFYRKSDGADGVHVFKGLSFGYSGEGSRGMMEFMKMFGMNPDKNKVLTSQAFPQETGRVNIKDFE